MCTSPFPHTYMLIILSNPCRDNDSAGFVVGIICIEIHVGWETLTYVLEKHIHVYFGTIYLAKSAGHHFPHPPLLNGSISLIVCYTAVGTVEHMSLCLFHSYLPWCSLSGRPCSGFLVTTLKVLLTLHSMSCFTYGAFRVPAVAETN